MDNVNVQLSYQVYVTNILRFLAQRYTTQKIPTWYDNSNNEPAEDQDVDQIIEGVIHRSGLHVIDE